MLNLLSGDDLYAHVLMQRVSDDRTVLVVEGPADCRILDPHLSPRDACTIPGNGKASVLRVAEILASSSSSEERVLCIVDRDESQWSPREDLARHVVVTTAHDLDAEIIYASDLLSRLARSLCDSSILSGLDDAEILNVVETIATPPSVLRFVSDRDGLGLNMRDFPVASAYEISLGRLDIAKLVLVAESRSNASPPPGHTLKQLEHSIENDLHLVLVSGHDLISAISVVFRYQWGGGNDGSKSIGKILRASCSCLDLIATDVYREISAWAARNSCVVFDCPSRVALVA